MMTIRLFNNCKALGVITRPNRNFAQISRKAQDHRCISVQFHFSLKAGGGGGRGRSEQKWGEGLGQTREKGGLKGGLRRGEEQQGGYRQETTKDGLEKGGIERVQKGRQD